MNLSLVSSSTDNALPEFVDYLYGGLTGYVAAARKEPQKDKNDPVVFNRSAFAWPERRDDLLGWIKENASTHEVYLAPAIFSAPSGRREDFKESNVLWADLDGKIPSEAQIGSIPQPTMRIQSSDSERQHWYWRLDAPISSVKEIESINRALAFQLDADPSGWDAGQVLRPPDTYNHKRGHATILLGVDGRTVTPNNFDVLPPVEAVTVDIPEQIPDVADVVMAHAFPKEVADLYRSRVEGSADRSDMLMRLGYYLAEMGLSDAEMFSVLRNADDRWGKFKDRTDRNQRLSDLIGVAKRKYPGFIDVADDAIQIYGLQSFLNTEVEIEWAIEGLLQTMGYMLLTGPAGVGKTQFSLRWAINLALGRNFLGLKVVAPQRILFFSLEMGHADLKFFLSTMCADMPQEELFLLEQNLLIAPMGEAFYLDQSEQQSYFEEILRTFAPSGVFIDSVGSSSSGNVSDESTVKALMDFNDKIRQRHNVFTWFIHHNRKAQGDNKKPNKLADVYGNQYLVNRATSVYCLWPSGSSIEVIPLKKRLAPMEDPWHINRMANLDFLKKEGSVTFKNANVLELDTPSSNDFPTSQGIVDL